MTLQNDDALVGSVTVGGTLPIPAGVGVVVGSSQLRVQAAHIVIHHDHAGWTVARTAVPFAASFIPITRTWPGSFGGQVNDTPVSPQPPLPNSPPIALTMGAITMR